MKKFLSMALLGLAIPSLAQTDQERCEQGAIDNSVVCVKVAIRDFNLWDGYLGSFIKHPDFEQFANTKVPSTDPASHGCGNTPLINRDFLMGERYSTDPNIAAWAEGLLANDAVALAPLKYGEARNTGDRGFLIELERDGQSQTLWNQAVTITQGMVGPELNGDGKPVKVADACDNSLFDQWFYDVPGVNFTINDVMVLELIRDNGLSKTYQISSNSYFPLDKYHGTDVPNFGKQAYKIWCGADRDPANTEKCNQMSTDWTNFNANDPDAHNYGYTMEGEIDFAYHGGEVFTFSGDDDMWIFIDGRLAADIGGVHLPGPQIIVMDNLAAAYGWDLHTEHKLKFFYADRQTDGSNLIITTTLNDVGIPDFVPATITKAITKSGQYSSFVIYSHIPLTDETIAAVNNGQIPTLIASNTGVNPVVTGIAPSDDITNDRLGTPYLVTVSANRPNQNDSISFNPAAEMPIIGSNGKPVTAINNKLVEFKFEVGPKEPVKTETPASVNPLPLDPTSPAVLDAIYGPDNGNAAPGTTTNNIGDKMSINRGAEITLIPTNYLQPGDSVIANGRADAAGNFTGTTDINGNPVWGMVGNPAAPGVVSKSSSHAAPTVNCKVAGVRNTCFDFQFVVSGSFRINMFMYDQQGQFIRQYSQYISKGALDSLRSLMHGGNILDSNADGVPEVLNPAVAVNVGLYPLAEDGRSLANGVYIITYDILEYPEETQIYEGGIVNGNVVSDFSQPNRTIQTVRLPYRRSPK